MVRIGISLVAFNGTYQELRDAALTVEESGYDSLWVVDHFISFISETDPVLECWSLLAGLAELTSKIKLGSCVTNVMNRHPDVLAKTVATVQQMSGGRIQFGIGGGSEEKEQTAYGRPFPGGGERVGRVREAVEVMHLLWSGKVVDYEGQYYQVKGGLSLPPPKPIPPIMVAGMGPVSARQAARIGDGWTCDGPRGLDKGPNIDYYKLKDMVLEELDKLGRPRDSFEISVTEYFDDQFQRDPIERIEEAEKDGIDLLVLEAYPPFDRGALASVAKVIYK